MPTHERARASRIGQSSALRWRRWRWLSAGARRRCRFAGLAGGRRQRVPHGHRCAARHAASSRARRARAARRRHAGSHRCTDAFSQLLANMPFAQELDFKIGNGIFRKIWVSAPSSTKSSDGLGPLYNARACQACHLKDGRGHPPARRPARGSLGVDVLALLHSAARPTRSASCSPSARLRVIPEPTYGGQLQELGVQGHASEGRMVVKYQDVPVTLAGGETVIAAQADATASPISATARCIRTR